MTAAFLQSELASLISDSKRKHGDIKSAAEKSSADLKTISVTSETQLAGDLLRRPQFIDPFLLACKSQNVKLASTGAACLQRLIASTAIPRSRLPDVLSAFQDAVPLALEVQLKILQTLPSLLQLYASDLHGESLAITLGVSAELSGSKLAVVSNTAAATFQQLVTSVFERGSRKEEQNHENGSNEKSSSYDDSQDAALVFSDICALLTGDQPRFVRLSGLSPSLILETIESLLSNHGFDVFANDMSLESCQKYLVPGLSRLVEGSTNFSVVARSFRILFILTTEHFDALKATLDDVFSIILSALDRTTSNRWKRALCLEFFRGVCSDFDTLRNIFSAHDQASGSKSIIFELMATLVRIASEDPSLIGLGRQSTIPTNQNDDDAGDATGAVDLNNAATALGSVAQAGSSATGISTEWSTISSPCLDQIDRSNALEIPETYIYTVVLGCVAAFSEGLSKFIMPLSVPSRRQVKPDDVGEEHDTPAGDRSRTSTQRSFTGQKYQQLVNPLTRKDLERYVEVQVCAKMIEDCWPAVLAICSTFLNAALDSYFYHILVRTVQKLAQVSGVLELHTPRDALLTTLAKVSVPISVSRLMNHYYGGRSAKQFDPETAYEAETATPATPIPATPSESFDLSRQSLNMRNLLCLRAILNLGIALGPTLSTSAWTIILQSLQQVEALLSIGTTPRPSTVNTSGQGDGGAQLSLASEITAVETATKRMMESTKTYPESSFGTLVNAIFGMADDAFPMKIEKQVTMLSPTDAEQKESYSPRHKSTRSISGSWAKTMTLEIEVQFVLKTVAKIASANIHRFTSPQSATYTWDLITTKLLNLQNSDEVTLSLRLQASNAVDRIVIDCGGMPGDGDDTATIVQEYAIPSLQKQLKTIPKPIKDPNALDFQVEIHQNLLNALEILIGQCGDLFKNGWKTVFEILLQTVRITSSDESTRLSNHPDSNEVFASKTPFAAAFRCVQLIISDFLQTLDDASMSRLITILAFFGTQMQDLNMSLTAIALYWNIITILIERANNAENSFAFTVTRTDETRSTSLWQMAVTSLSQLCIDTRSDVQTAALRMILRTLEASNQFLTPASFNICIRDILLPLVRSQKRDAAESENRMTESLLQTIDSSTAWMQMNISSITRDSSFSETWSEICETFKEVLSQRQLSSTAAVYSSLSNMLSSLASLQGDGTGSVDKSIIRPVWMLWAEYHPADIEAQAYTQPNESALASHAQVLIELSKCSLETVATLNGTARDNIITKSMTRTVSFAKHSRYSNDTNKLSSEQEGIIKILHILRQILLHQQKRNAFCETLLAFTAEIRDLAELTARQGQTSGYPNGLQRPAYTAFLSQCLLLFKDVIETSATNHTLDQDIFIAPSLQLLSNFATRWQGNSKILDSTLRPVRRNASKAAVELIVAIQEKLSSLTETDIEGLGKPINEEVYSLITSELLDKFTAQPGPEAQLAYEVEDISLFCRVHEAAQPILQHESFPENWRKQYVLTLFHASLGATPWFGDFPHDMGNNPLENFNRIRQGSLRAPKLPPRRNVSTEALNALLDLTLKRYDGDNTSNKEPSRLAVTAGPYVLLRIAHPIKVFLADQRLRHLTPPHSALQDELQDVLTKALDLRTDSSAFQNVTGVNDMALLDDGKAHLRILYPLIVKLEEMWNDLPRLDFCAWQEDEKGKAIELALNKWVKVLGQGWGIQQETM